MLRSEIKTGVRCIICSRTFHDKSNFNRHHTSVHRNELSQHEIISFTDEGGVIQVGFDWKESPLPVASTLGTAAAPGLLERQTGILSKGVKFFSSSKWSDISDPSIKMRDAAVELLDEIDDFCLVASTLIRSQVNRAMNGSLKPQPFRALKDNTGVQYAVTVARFLVFARTFFEKEASTKELVMMALQETCTAELCCLEAFLLCLPVHVELYKNADPLQHAAVHVRRALRGTVMIHLKASTGDQVEEFCDKFLNPSKASAFGIMTFIYYEIRRCVLHDKRLLIQRCQADEGYPEGSAVLVMT